MIFKDFSLSLSFSLPFKLDHIFDIIDQLLPHNRTEIMQMVSIQRTSNMCIVAWSVRSMQWHSKYYHDCMTLDYSTFASWAFSNAC
jgi:hypothetical protein